MKAGSRACRWMGLACVAWLSLLPAFAQTVSPTSLNFGNQVQGSSSVVKSVTLKNGQSTAITITSITSNLSDYTQVNTCPLSPSTLGAGKSCTISVTFRPSALGSRAGTLSIVDTGKSSPQSVSLSGTGVAAVTALPSSISFGNQVIGAKSAGSKVTVTNNQTVALTVSKISTTLPDYSTTTTCPIGTGSLAGGNSCSVTVFFQPTVAGLRNDTLTITDNASVSPTVSLTGTGIVAAAVNPSSLNFGNQALGTSSAAQTVTFTNNQSTTLKITSIVISPSDFGFSSNCPISPSTLNSGASCKASVTFSPKQLNTRTGTLTFTDTANNSPQTVSLAGTGMAANLVSIAVTPANASIAAGTNQQFTATGAYTDGSTQNLTNSVAWTSSASSVAGISSQGLATGVAAGSASISASSGSISGSTTLTVGPPSLLSIAITPANSSLALGTTQALKATGTYSDGSTQDLTSSVTWASANAGIATVNSKGIASSVAVGNTNVTATSGAVVGSTSLTVSPATLVSIAVTPAIPSIPLGTTQQFTATGTFTDGSTQNLTSTAQWMSDTGSVATVSNAANSQGRAAGIGTGTANISATSGSISGTTKLTVTAASLVSIAVMPSNPSIALGTNQQFTAMGTFTDGSTQDLTASVQWSSDTVSVATISNGASSQGLATSVGTGSGNISATSGGLSGATVLTVTAAQLVSIAISPQTASVPLGVPQQFTALGTYTDGSTQDVTQTGHWSSTVANVATISNATGSQGLATSLGTGDTSISISFGSVSASATLTVSPAALVSIAISPSAPTIPFGTTQQFTATGTYTDSNTQDLTSVVTWSSSAAQIGVISNASGTNGLLTSAGVGSTSITAAMGSISSSTTLTVATAALVSISVAPASGSIPLGSSQQFIATGTYTDGSTQDLTSSATWSSDTTQVASIGATGVAVGVGLGSANIIASSGLINGSALLVVGPAVLVSLAVSPGSASIVAGTTLQFLAIGTYSDGSVQSVTNLVTWSSSMPAAAAVNSTGLATGIAQGASNLTASLGAMTASATLSVTPAVLVSIAVIPQNASFALGTGQQLKATGTYTDGSTQDLTATVAWSTGNPAIATVNAQGSAASVAVGTTTATAQSGSISGSTTVNVTPAVLVSIAVTPAIPNIPVGTTLQFAATGTFTDGSTQDVTKSVEWTSDTTSAATISNAANQIGLATSVNTGTATITATSGSVTASTTLTVTAAALVSIAVTPANPSIALGTNQQFTATGTFTDGSFQDLTSTVSWSSDTPLTAGISNAGLLTSLAEGTTDVSATSGSVVGSTTVIVTAAQLISIAATPQNASVPLGSTQQFTATGTYSDGSTQDVTQSAHWGSTDASVSTISNASGSVGLATTLSAGTTTITVGSGSIEATAALTVNPAALVSIAISPQNASIALGTSQQFTATGTYTDGSTRDVTSIVTWSSSAASVLVVSNTAGKNGLATSAAVGTATISATSGSVSSSTNAVVGQATLVSIAVTPAASSIAQGYTLQFAATGTFSDASTQDLTQSSGWNSSMPNVASISATGLASALLAGSTIISASSGPVSGSTTLSVSAPVPTMLSVSPSNPSIYVNGQQQFSATLIYSDASSFDVTNSVTWMSFTPAVASISSGGLATGTASGSSTIEAGWGNNALIGTTTIKVMPFSVTVVPSSASIAISGTQQFSAAVAGTNNQTVTWAVDGITGGNSSLGTINTSGFYTAPPMIGNHAITATAQASSSSVGVASLTIGSLVPVVNTFFGMHLHSASSAVPGKMEGAARIWDSNAAQWPNLNMASGTFNWTNLDNVLATYKTAGINDVLYTLWRVPKWASSNPSDTTCDYASLGANFTGSCDLPTDLNADGTGTNLTWRNWVQNIAQHVNNPTYLQTHAKISYWDPCNECFRSPTLDPGYGAGGASIAYRGSYDQLVRMMQDARCIIVGNPNDPITALNTTCAQAGYPVIGIDPTAKMVMPSTSPTQASKTTPPYPQVMQNILYCTCAKNSCSASPAGCTTGAAGSGAVDLLSVHIYPNNYTPEQIPSQVAVVRSYLNATDLAKPLWNSEGGWGQNATASQITNGDSDLEAGWVARFHLMSWASGLGRTYWYQWDNAAFGTLWSATSIPGCTTAFTSGFICSGGIAYQQVHDWILGATLTNCSAVSTSWTCNLIQANGSPAQIVWDTSQTCSNGICGTIQYSVSPTFNTYKDLSGAAYSINGAVPIGIKPILLFTQ